MDKRRFDQLVKGVREMKRHMAGKSVRGAPVTELNQPDVRAIREAGKISQSQFAKLDRREAPHLAELGAAPYVRLPVSSERRASDGSRTCCW
jgi:hypothetical protein